MSTTPSATVKSFTLIELLVVTTIIAILASFVMPALMQARLRSQGTAAADQLKQMGVGFLMYADDSDENMYGSPTQQPMAIDEAPFMYKRNPDLSTVAREYQFDSLTGHPITGAMPWTDAGNDQDVQWGTWSYFPGYAQQYKDYVMEWQPGDPVPTAPTKLARAESENVIMSEMLVKDSMYGGVRGVHVTDGKLVGVEELELEPTYKNSSFKCLKAPTEANAKGTHGIFFDGRVEWRDAKDLERYYVMAYMFRYSHEELLYIPQPY